MPARLWERHEHGDRCSKGNHLPYRVRKPGWVEIRCKLCKNVELEMYGISPLTEREEAA